MDNRSHRDSRAAPTDWYEASSESTSYDWAHRETSRHYLRSPSLAPTLTSPLHLDHQPKNWLERIPKGTTSKKGMISGKSVPENTELSFFRIFDVKTGKTKKSVTPTVLLSMERTSSSAAPAIQASPEADGSGGFTDKQPLEIAWRSLFASPQIEAIISNVVEYFGKPRLLSTSRPLRNSSRKSQLSSPPAPVSPTNPSSLLAIITNTRLSSLQSMSLEAVQAEKRSLSATQSGETENERPIKAQKLGQASVREQKRQEGDLVNTPVAALPESNPPSPPQNPRPGKPTTGQQSGRLSSQTLPPVPKENPAFFRTINQTKFTASYHHQATSYHRSKKTTARNPIRRRRRQPLHQT